MDKNWIYYGIFLDNDESERLFNIVNSLPGIDIPTDWKKYCHHMTIVYNDKSEVAQAWANLANKKLGEYVCLTVTQVGISDKAIAVKVSGGMTANDIPHITVACSPIGKPVDSNKITNWRDIDNFKIDGIVSVFDGK